MLVKLMVAKWFGSLVYYGLAVFDGSYCVGLFMSLVKVEICLFG